MIPVLFNILFFLIPLIFFKNTSELFEFNKIVTLYAFTSVITTVWIINSIKIRKFIFQKTILDWPLIVYLSIYFFSTILSLDPRTSVLGYYSRFNGGLLSQVCYAILYWAFVSNVSSNESKRIVISSIIGTALASLLAVFEHFGLFTTCGLMNFGWKSSCWVQDVQSRVFSTLGQPNWLAALVVTLIPFTWSQMVNTAKNEKIKNNKKLLLEKIPWLLFFILFFVTLLFTKSRSGLLAFGIEVIIYWGLVFWKQKGKYLKEFIALGVTSVILFLVIQLPTSTNTQTLTTKSNGPALESGGTESGTIRKYVWLGAFEVFKHYPILGSGPETFAFSFPMYKPVGHNLTSEWDFIYNKAHNEFLNYLANTGIFGFISYLSLIFYSLLIIYRSGKYGYLAGYISILVTNFFGFSVVPVSLLFFLIPAISLIESGDYKLHLNKTKLNFFQYFGIILSVLVSIYLLYLVYGYWNADVSYNKGKTFNRSNKQSDAAIEINKAIKFSKNEALYVSELALSDGKDETAMKAFDLAPYNQNVRKILISNLVKNSGTDINNLLTVENIILDGISKAPNDPRLYYQLGILQLKINKNSEALVNLQRSISLKPNYKEGRFALGATYKSLNINEKAKEQFNYILNNIDPNDELTKKYLDELK